MAGACPAMPLGRPASAAQPRLLAAAASAAPAAARRPRRPRPRRTAPAPRCSAGAGGPAGRGAPPEPPGGAASAVAAASEEAEAANRQDVYRAIAIGGAVSVAAALLDHDWIEQHQGLAMSCLFALAYCGIIVEELVGLNKAAVALLLAVSLWIIRGTSGDPQVDAEVSTALASVSELIFFLLGAMTVVEVVDAHGGFKRLSAYVRADRRPTLAWGVGLLTFFMSAALDNLTTTIVLLSVLQRAVPGDREFRKLLGAIVVIAANAGGAWTPIGDITTTMLWVSGQITAGATMVNLLLPSLVSMAVPVALMCATAPELQGPVEPSTGGEQQQGRQASAERGPPAAAGAALKGAVSAATGDTGGGAMLGPTQEQELQEQERRGSHAEASSSGAGGAGGGGPELISSNRDVLVLSVGLGALLFVPAFKYLTGLPPYMGTLSGLAVLWLVTDALHWGEDRQYPRVPDALRNLDIAGVFFFLGILLAVEALDSAGLLRQLAAALSEAVPNIDLVAASIGAVSALVDNVPLVAAAQGMWTLDAVPPDSQLWQLIALCAGTGGSLLVIGSAAGVAYMGIEGAGFGWYLRRVSPWAAAGYVAAISVYAALHGLPSSTSSL